MNNKKPLIIGAVILVIVFGSFFIMKSRGNDQVPNVPEKTLFQPEENTTIDQVVSLIGTWTGGWKSVDFGKEGVSSMVITALEDGRLSLEMDFADALFGDTDYEPKTLFGNVSDQDMVFILENDEVYGDMTIRIDAQGNINVLGLDLSREDVASYRIQGKVLGGRLELGYVVVPKDKEGKEVKGSIVFDKQI